ncbi:DUF1800 domain-containing protein [Marinimicrobium agarilyticum]|uniref:DUF1800 domain-containing protein n=1 Tax=Marinimicrobium agarilyticum TaxID=306546 RepID=UPI0003F8D131|nr:DUF1800 domain-containing protein [Marinimicrobium agarilyticum]
MRCSTRLLPRGFLWSLLISTLLSLSACGGGSTEDSDAGPDEPPATSSPKPEPTPEPSPSPEPQPQPEPEPLPTLEPDTEPDPALPEREEDDWTTAVEASRFLTQTTFGPTAKSLHHYMAVGQDAWLEAQFNTPFTPNLALLDQRVASLDWEAIPAEEDDDEGYLRDLQRSDVWWEIILRGDDQLRQRIAFALSQIFVISNVSDVLYNDTRGIADYHDTLARHAFGNYRELLEAVTLHPMMGEYLSSVRNRKADEAENIRPDENYAREVMQLFSIGLEELNLDGTVKTDDQGEPIPTYDQETIKAFARVFTGWNFATAEHWWEWTSDAEGEAMPMKAFQATHDTAEKTLLNGETLPSGQTAEQDMEQALDNLFNHPNVGPFIGKQLIQRLVTSNPSPEYVERVAQVFNDNGAGTRGDLEAVVRAIVTDEEARTGHLEQPETFGKLREPILQFSHLWRVFKAQGVEVHDEADEPVGKRIRFRGSDRAAGQRPYGSFSVFNFYRPGYSHPGAISDAGLLSPEFQIHTESVMVAKTNQLTDGIFWRDMDADYVQSQYAQQSWDIYPPALNMSEEKALAGEPQALVDRLDLLLTAGQLPAEARELLVQYLNGLPNPTYSAHDRRMRVFEAASLIVASPYFAVQR